MPRARRLPSGAWNVRVYAGKDAAGKEKYESFTADTRREAEQAAAMWQLDRKKRRMQSITLGAAMDQYIETCRVAGYSPSTIPAYKSTRKNAFTDIIDRPVDTLTVPDIQSAINARASEHSAKTVRNDYFFLEKVILQHRPDLNLRPIVLPKRQHGKKQVFSTHWAREILDYAKANMPADFYIYCTMIISAGLRPSETYSLTWGDLSAAPMAIIDSGETFQVGEILVDSAEVRDEYGIYTSKAPKTESGNRRIQVAWNFFEDLYSVKSRGNENDRIVKTKPNMCTKYWARTREALGLPEGLRYYDLRHYHATQLVASGASEEELAARMGHSTSAFSHQVYVETLEEHQTAVSAVMARKTAALYGPETPPERAKKTGNLKQT